MLAKRRPDDDEDYEENLREQKIASERLLDEEKVKMRESLRREYNEEFNLKSREIQQTIATLMFSGMKGNLFIF